MPGVRPELIFVAGPQKDQRAVLMNNLMIAGRSPQADIPILEQFVSRQHVQFSFTRDGWIVECLTKTGKMEINGKKYKPGKKILLDSGDCVAIGMETQMLFVDAQDNPATVLAAYRDSQPQPEPIPVPPPAPLPVEPPQQEAPVSAGPIEMLPVPQEEEENKTPEQEEAEKRAAKKRIYMILGGVWLGLIVVVFAFLSQLPRGGAGGENGALKNWKEGEIEQALTAPLKHSVNRESAQKYLEQAQKMYRDRNLQHRPNNLYLTVLSYRLHRSYLPKNNQALRPNDERKYKQAEEELVKKVVGVYRDIRTCERRGYWDDAKEQLEYLQAMIPLDDYLYEDPSTTKFMDHVRKRLNYVVDKMGSGK